MSALAERFAPVLRRIADRAREHERSGTRPYDEVRELADAGFGAVRLPLDRGGAGAGVRELFELLIALGEADSNQPQLWRNHLAFVEDRLLAGSAADPVWVERIAAGEVFGGAWSELGSNGLDKVGTRLTRDSDGGVLDGTKYYSTGSIYADWISVFALDQDAAPVIAIIRADAPGVTLLDDWTGVGQRQTGSGTTVFTGVQVAPEAIYHFEERVLYQEVVYQLVLLASLVGVGRAARAELVSAVRERRRNYPHGLDPEPRRDAQLQAVVGRVSALVTAAEAVVLRAAGLVDPVADALASGADPASEEVQRLATEAAIASYEAQVTVTDAILEATTILFDALGSSAVLEEAQLDRHWRNARTLSSHNPRVYKARVVGDWLLNDASPLRIYESADERRTREEADAAV
ncbi:acyl-CoA dehydrogenase family protein [Protaetiibacter intestinalis]|uniref:Acyl-CoA dehydrogenase C-terminal domain-containing protein n=1 Tax=Protaetiibacter intestinalis TaxID=2419774 RepID=A0A387B3J5_9MICO|nr:hypothetical protein [Protaetiibacter intestinalis]AYF98184.1 hypothetical protein D7I47_07910 [Protaetiibacter intestinalis]